MSPDCCQPESEFFLPGSSGTLLRFSYIPISFFTLSNVIFALLYENQNSNLADPVKGIECECHASTIHGATIGTLSKFCARFSLQFELGNSH